MATNAAEGPSTGKRPALRRKKFIDPAYQLRYSLTLATLATCEGVALSGVLLTAIFSVIEISPENHIRLFYYIVGIAVAMIVILGLVNIGLGILLSHRVSGPVYRFIQVAKQVATGDLSQVIRLREKDELQELRGQLNEMLDGLRGLVREQNHRIDTLADAVRRLQSRGAQAGNEQAWGEILTELDTLKGKFII